MCMSVFVYVWINLAPGDFSLWVAMTFALPGVEEREADSDGVCEQLSHLLQAMGYVAGLSKLTVCNAPLPSLPASHPPSLSVINLPPPPSSFTLPSLLLFSWPNDCLGPILSDPLCFMLPQPTVYLYLSPSLCPSLLFSNEEVLEGSR